MQRKAGGGAFFLHISDPPSDVQLWRTRYVDIYVHRLRWQTTEAERSTYFMYMSLVDIHGPGRAFPCLFVGCQIVWISSLSGLSATARSRGRSESHP